MKVWKILWRIPFYTAVLVLLDGVLGTLLNYSLIGSHTSLTGFRNLILNPYHYLVMKYSSGITVVDASFFVAFVAMIGTVVIVIDVIRWILARNKERVAK